jgi:hypothetical protein
MESLPTMTFYHISVGSKLIVVYIKCEFLGLNHEHWRTGCHGELLDT